jgi:hypothetical protein
MILSINEISLKRIFTNRYIWRFGISTVTLKNNHNVRNKKNKTIIESNLFKCFSYQKITIIFGLYKF